MINVTYNVDSVNKVVKLIEKKFEKLNLSVQQQLDNAAILVTKEVKASIFGERNEPRSYKTGNFYRSILPRKIDDKSTVVETNVPYALHLEYGTSVMMPRHHFRNTTERLRPIIKQVFKVQI